MSSLWCASNFKGFFSYSSLQFANRHLGVCLYQTILIYLPNFTRGKATLRHKPARPE